MSKLNKTIQEKTAELDSLVKWFDGDQFDIEDAINKFKKAESLAIEIEKDLDSIKNEIRIVKQKFDNKS